MEVLTNHAHSKNHAWEGRMPKASRVVKLVSIDPYIIYIQVCLQVHHLGCSEEVHKGWMDQSYGPLIHCLIARRMNPRRFSMIDGSPLGSDWVGCDPIPSSSYHPVGTVLFLTHGTG